MPTHRVTGGGAEGPSQALFCITWKEGGETTHSSVHGSLHAAAMKAGEKRPLRTPHKEPVRRRGPVSLAGTNPRPHTQTLMIRPFPHYPDMRHNTAQPSPAQPHGTGGMVWSSPLPLRPSPQPGSQSIIGLGFTAEWTYKL